MTTCPTHQDSAPPPPEVPHSAQADGRVCKGCLAPAGSPAERRSHHCPCCGEKYMSSCTGRRQSCLRCGTFDTGTGQWLPPVDPIADLLSCRDTPTPWLEAWRLASLRFGQDVAHYLHQVTTEIDQGHLYGRISFRGAALMIRFADRRFEAASPCPLQAECRRGRVWTPVRVREDLLTVHLNGPGPDASECDRVRLHH